MPRAPLVPAVLLAFLILSALTAGGAAAQIARQESEPLDALVLSDPRLRPSQLLEPFEAVRAGLAPAVADGWDGFLRRAGSPWSAQVNRQSGRIESAEGGAIPWKATDLPALERTARGFLPQVAPLLGVDPGELVLNASRSGQLADHLWTIDFDVHRGGLPVEGARVVFRVNNGHLVQIGTENLPSPHVAVPEARIGRPEALARLADFVGGFSAADSFFDGGSLHLLPIAGKGGREFALVWQIGFQRAGSTGTWRARVDATTGELLEFLDINRYAEVLGGVYPVSPTAGPQTILPLPHADVSPLGFTDSSGWYTFPGGTASSSLNGPYVRIQDACGPISRAASTSGRIAFEAAPGTDCATPGVGGPGNTASTRSLFYHLNRGMEAARAWLPGNPWLNRPLTANSNIGSLCNAYWNGTSVTFFRSGDGCGNTGEIAAVALHELGHGLDANDGNGPSPDFATGETYGDFTAVLASRDSCIGQGFFLNGNCGGYGDACTACSGVRDIDWARHVSGKPHTVANFTQPFCQPSGTYYGPCGREGHCESYILSEALWDLAARDLPDPGSAAAWAVVERLWYQSRGTATQGFACNTATSPWTSNGCNTGSLWKTLRAADDDDGNLANGTPHSCHLFAAFDRHGIACPSDPGAATCYAACTPPPVPTLAATAQGRQVQLSWNAPGSGAVVDVLRSEAGCEGGWVRIAEGLSGTSLTDSAVAWGQTYSYRVVARPAGNAACSAPPSACRPVALPPSPCTVPATPPGLTARTISIDRIELSWHPGAGATEVSVFRATSSNGPWTRVGVVPASATSWSDSGLTENTTYFYALRASQDDCASARSVPVQTRTARCETTLLYANDFESGSGLSDWTVGSLGGTTYTADWRGIQACGAYSGSGIFRFGGASCAETCRRAVSAFAQPRGATGIAVPAEAARTRLSFWHRWDFQMFESGSLRTSVDGGTWINVPKSAILAGGTNIFEGSRATFLRTEVDLDAMCNRGTGKPEGCAGHTLRTAFAAQTDVGEALGWFLDDVEISVCRPVLDRPEPFSALDFYTLPPCRLLDTRLTSSPGGGQPLGSNSLSLYTVAGSCGIPANARAVVLNATAVQPTAAGYLSLYPAGSAPTVNSTVNFPVAGLTRSNNALIGLSDSGALAVQAGTPGSVHLVLDAYGYYAE